MRIFAKVSGLYCCMSVAGIRVIKGFSRVLESTACTRLPSSKTFSFPFEPKQTLECREVTSPPWTVFLQLLCISCRWCSGCSLHCTKVAYDNGGGIGYLAYDSEKIISS